MMTMNHFSRPRPRPGSDLLGREPWPLTVTALCLVLIVAGCAFTDGQSTGIPGSEKAVAEPKPTQEIALRAHSQLLPGDRTVLGTVEAIQGEQIKVKHADSLQPRYLPLAVAQAKGMDFHPGDRVKMVFNEQQVLVDFHPLGHTDGHHTVITGHIAQQMTVGHEQVVVKTEGGQVLSYPVSPLIRSKLASMPIGAPAVFLVDETDHIADVTFGDLVSLEQIKREYRQMSNPKSPHIRVDGTVIGVAADGRITIKTTDGEQRMYPVRPYAEKELASVRAGDEITLLIDSGQHVLDIARLNK